MSEQERDKQDQFYPTIIRELYMHTFRGKWEEVENLYETKPEVWNAEITSSEDTALHMAINENKEDVVGKLVDIIIRLRQDHLEEAKKALKKKNEVGDTPLHRAAARGSVKMCKRIVEAAKSMGENLLGITNKWGENPMFVAVLDNRKQAFIYFHGASDKGEDNVLSRSAKGDTVLHAAIRREHYDLAFQILQLYPNLAGSHNVMGVTPLHILASKSPAFKSGSHLYWWQSIIYHCIRVDPLVCDTSHPERSSALECADNYRTRYEFLSRLCFGRSVIAKRDPENHYVRGNVPENCVTWFQFLFMVLRDLFGFLGLGNTFKEIIEARQKHTWSVQILNELMKDPGNMYTTKEGTSPGPGQLPADFGVSVTPDDTLADIQKIKPKRTCIVQIPDELMNTLAEIQKNKQNHSTWNVQTLVEQMKDLLVRLDFGGSGDKKKDDEPPKRTDTALLVAAQKGVVEVVNRILERFPVFIHDTSSNKKNIVLVAVENRQPTILEALHTHFCVKLKKPQLWQDLIQSVDADDNTILHLAAKYDESKSLPWQIRGSAMQMQWEIKWYEHVKSFLPTHFVFLANNEGKTPVQIFTEEHKYLIKNSSEWLKETSESCSVVAALVAGVSFATSSQVPGGTDDKTGRPKLEGQPPFDLFAVTALIALCFSVTALIMFLAILTSRKQPKDFKTTLPRRLLLGLSSLFVSIVSMLISFCAAHFFVLEDRFKRRVFLLYVATCLPVSFYAIAQFPLYMDLLKFIFSRVPQTHDFGNL
ncbi:hypothetical protein QN277_009912 [Acacia crassicarpa]|nr:hypothetical protein QN277_009912 [Acacia crassicarpa]